MVGVAGFEPTTPCPPDSGLIFSVIDQDVYLGLLIG
jgi:hypothetical protein